VEIDDESLVAFLDGELPDEEASRIKAAAAESEAVQKRIDQLSQSWAMLDDLPDERLNADIAQSTLEMVSLAIDNDQKVGQRRRKLRGLIAIACLSIVALLAGVGISKTTAFVQEQSQLRNLHIVVASERLRLIPSTEFLEMLADLELLNDAPGQSFESDVFANARIFQMQSVSERKAWVQTLEPSDKAELARKFQRYNNASEEQREASRDIAAYAMQQGDRKSKLFQAANAYFRLAQNNQFEQTMSKAIREGDVELQRQLIVEELAYNYQLNESDHFTILQWSEEWAADTQLEYAFRDVGLDLQLDQLVFHYLDLPEDVSILKAKDIQWLVDDLEGYSHDLLEALPDGLRRDVVANWFADAILESDSDVQLAERFSALSPRKKNEILMLPFDAAREQLTKPLSVPVPESN
jgi:hypothetical protein